MTKSLIKNLTSFILMIAVIVISCVALLAASDSFNDGILGASVDASKHITGDVITARSSDQISTHTCSQDGDASDYNTKLRVYVVYNYTYNGETITDTAGSQEDDTNFVTLSFSTGFGRDLEYVRSAHRAQLFCESESSECSLYAIAD